MYLYRYTLTLTYPCRLCMGYVPCIVPFSQTKLMIRPCRTEISFKLFLLRAHCRSGCLQHCLDFAGPDIHRVGHQLHECHWIHSLELQTLGYWRWSISGGYGSYGLYIGFGLYGSGSKLVPGRLAVGVLSLCVCVCACCPARLWPKL